MTEYQSTIGSIVSVSDDVRVSFSDAEGVGAASKEIPLTHGLGLLEEFTIDASRQVTTSGAGTRRRLKYRPKLRPGERSFLIVESEGVYQVVLPGQKSAGAASVERASDEFEIDIGVPHSGAVGAQSVGDFIGRIWQKAKVTVFKFLAEKTLQLAAKKIDGDGPFGLFEIKRPKELATWTPKRSNKVKSLNVKTKKVLLLLHGTFSTTLDSFGALASVDLFTSKAKSHYDAVLGFDHKTLGLNIQKNAEEVASELAKIDTGDEVIEIDVLGYSRGGLVLRWLIEKELAELDNWAFGRGVFFGAPLAGTSLASAANWSALIDVYANAIAFTSQIFGWISGGSSNLIIGAITKALGGLIKYVVEAGTKPNVVPGLASMVPDNPLIGELQAGDHSEADSYFGFTSNYEPEFDSSTFRNVKALVVDRVADRLFDADNDLVVQQSSMTALDSETSIKGGVLAFGPNDAVMHTAYLANARTVSTLLGWLEIAPEITSSEIGLEQRFARPSSVLGSMAGPRLKPPEQTGRYLVSVRKPQEEASGVSSASNVPLLSNLIGPELSAELDIIRPESGDRVKATSLENSSDNFEIGVLDPTRSAGASAAEMALRSDDRVSVVPEFYVSACTSDFERRGQEWIRGGQNLLLDYILKNGGDTHQPKEPTPSEVAQNRPDPNFNASASWPLQMVGADTVNTATGRGIKVAVLDTGIALNHPDFQHHVDLKSRSRNFVNGSDNEPVINSDVEDDNGHGTHVAGLIAGGSPNALGFKYGVAPNVELYVAKVLDARGDGKEADIIRAMIWARDQGCDIINMSLTRRVVVEGDLGGDYGMVAESCINRDCLPIAAAGNDSYRNGFGLIAPVGAPACAKLVMAVGAVDRDGAIGDFSNGGIYGDSPIEVVAPGVDVPSAFVGRVGHKSISGTSMACPIVSGVAALYAEIHGLRGARLWRILTENSRRLPGLPDRDQGNGLVIAPA